MLRKSPVTSWSTAEKLPLVHESAFVDRDAVLIGEVIVSGGVIVLPRAVIRADEGQPVIIGEGSNVQDGVIIHALKGSGVSIGRNCSVAHGAVVHGPCIIGDGCFIGFCAILLKAGLGEKCFVSHGAVVTGVEIPAGKCVPAGAVIDTREKAESLESVTGEMLKFNEEVLAVNRELLRGYRKISGEELDLESDRLLPFRRVSREESRCNGTG